MQPISHFLNSGGLVNKLETGLTEKKSLGLFRKLLVSVVGFIPGESAQVGVAQCHEVEARVGYVLPLLDVQLVVGQLTGIVTGSCNSIFPFSVIIVNYSLCSPSCSYF